MKDAAPARGFTLLEVMIALAILSSTLVVLLEIITNNVRATNHAKLTTAATFLARGKMIDIEDDIFEKGFIDADDKANGAFKEYPAFRWETAVERVELPTDMTQKAQQQATDTSQSKDPMQALTGMMGGLMSSFMDPIRIGLQESVRRVTVKVFWYETGRSEQMIDVVTFLTDPAKLDASLTMGAGAGAGGAAPGAAPSVGAAAGGVTK
jgi:prepilin-type N-terminal cleavage/methylation domain-containing protein